MQEGNEKGGGIGNGKKWLVVMIMKVRYVFLAVSSALCAVKLLSGGNEETTALRGHSFDPFMWTSPRG